MADKPIPDEVHFRYITPSDYRTFLVTGVWGGVSTSGMISADLFIETNQTPIASGNKVNPDGTLGEPLASELPKPEGIWIERHLQARIMVTPRTAKMLADWLMGKVKDVEEAEARKGEGT